MPDVDKGPGSLRSEVTRKLGLAKDGANDLCLGSVYLLWHGYKLAEYEDHDKLLGAYATKDDAQAAIEFVRDQPGFRDYTDGFLIEEYELGRVHWAEGFIRWDEA